MNNIKNNLRIFHITFLLAIASIISIIYSINQPIDFHCDSATFYNFGSKISEIFSILGIVFILPLVIIISFFKNIL